MLHTLQVLSFFSSSTFLDTKNVERPYLDFSIFAIYFKQKGSVAMSENKFTDKNVIARCVPMSKLQSVIGGKWKILIFVVCRLLQSAKVWRVNAPS